MSNTFGRIFRLTSFGESHGKAVGGVIDGCPARIPLDTAYINHELSRRRPGQSSITTQRNEKDQVNILSGEFEGYTTGTPIGFVIWNQDPKSDDYDNLREVFRPSHADYTYYAKYGIRDHRGGGRQSARVTSARVVAGAVARLALNTMNISIHAYTSAVGSLALDKTYEQLDLSAIDSNIVRCPDEAMARRMIESINEVKERGDTIGGTVTCVIKNVPAGWGEPEFNKLSAQLGNAMLSINAVKGFELGSGFSSLGMRGSQHNDTFYNESGRIRTHSNYSGGVQGGISNGEDIVFRVVFKPVATILQEQHTLNISGEPVSVNPRGRHDPCVLPRAVPIVEAMAAMTLLDFALLRQTNRI